MWRRFSISLFSLAAGVLLLPNPSVQAQNLDYALTDPHFTSTVNDMRTCRPPKASHGSYPDNFVPIFVECSGQVFVNDIPLSLAELEAAISRFQSLPDPSNYELKAETRIEHRAYLDVRDLLERNQFKPNTTTP